MLSYEVLNNKRSNWITKVQKNLKYVSFASELRNNSMYVKFSFLKKKNAIKTYNNGNLQTNKITGI